MRKILSLLILSLGLSVSGQTFKASDRAIIADNPYTSRTVQNPTFYSYEGYDASLGGKITLQYLMDDHAFLKGDVRVVGQTFRVIGNYEGEGLYRAAVYNSARQPVGTIIWEHATEANLIDVEFSGTKGTVEVRLYRN